MATGIVRKLMGDHKHGAGNGIIRPVTATGAEVVGQDLFFNGGEVAGLGEDDAPLAVGDVVTYTYTHPANRGVPGMAPATPTAIEIARVERASQGEERGQPSGAATRSTKADTVPTVEEQMRARAIYRAI
jgi:hypothetical protein